MTLPKELEQQFLVEIHRFEEDKKMPYITSVERLGMEKGMAIGLEEGLEKGLEKGREEGLEKGREEGLRQGIELAVELKFGAAGLQFLTEITDLHDLHILQAIHQAIRTAQTVAELRSLISSKG